MLNILAVSHFADKGTAFFRIMQALLIFLQLQVSNICTYNKKAVPLSQIL